MTIVKQAELIESISIENTPSLQVIMQNAIGHELSSEQATELGFDLLEFIDALTGNDDDFRESC